MSIDVKLPPLPEPDVTSHIIDATMRAYEVRTYSGPQCVEHARAAVLADRAERGEPVAEIVGTEKRGFALMTIVRWEPGFDRTNIGTKLYTAPVAQPLTPLTDEQVIEMRSQHGWAKETIRHIERAILASAGAKS